VLSGLHVLAFIGFEDAGRSASACGLSHLSPCHVSSGSSDLPAREREKFIIRQQPPIGEKKIIMIVKTPAWAPQQQQKEEERPLPGRWEGKGGEWR